MPSERVKKASFYEKLRKAQGKIGAIPKDSTNPYFNSKYFDINGLLAVVKPILNEENLVVLQPLVVRDGKNAIETSIVDGETGDGFSSVVYLPEISDPQKMGSAITYLRRYALQSLLALEAEDDDANSARLTPPLSRPGRQNRGEPGVATTPDNGVVGEDDLI